jgi:hypothetical protein
MALTKTFRTLAVAAVLSALPAMLAGCAGDGIEFNGKIFEAAGLTQIGGSQKDPEVAQRTGLVVPPQTASLPVPGEGADVTASIEQQLPNDPQQLIAQKAAADEAARQAKCKENQNKTLEEGGTPCNSILTALTGKSLTETVTGKKE